MTDQLLAIRRRDPSFDGLFVYGVSTTAIYCRPSCPARPALAQHISFHATAAAAEQAGFRACLRCHPNSESRRDRQRALVCTACRMIDTAEEIPGLAELAGGAGLSPSHFHRLFRDITGVTPKAYADARRSARLQHKLATSDTVTQALYDAGFNAPSRFYEAAISRLGMTPRAWRRGGIDTAIRFAVGTCSLGAILVAATPIGICAILLGDDADVLVRQLQDRFPHSDLAGDDAEFAARVATVVGFVEQPAIGLDLPLDIRGTAFQQRVWQALRELPAGTTASYTEIAAAIGLPSSARAVARACASNNLAVAIPCHRVVRTDGALSGYRWGIERKQDLLDRERVA